jgi:acylglycerol lipase
MSLMPMPLSGTSVRGYEIIPDSPRAALIIVHGIAEHSGRYRHVMDAMTQRGIACFIYDQRGHGQHPGIRTHVEDFREFAGDLGSLVEAVRRRHASLPLFVWGHSMGSVVTLQAAVDGFLQVRGCITSGCALDALSAFDGWRGRVLRVANAIHPRRRISLGSNAALLTQVAAAQRSHTSDPLVSRTASLRLLHGFAASCRHCYARIPTIQLSWLAVHGGDDRICPVSGSARLIDLLGSKDKELVVYPGLLHEPHNENEAAQSVMFHRMSNWILDRST